MESKEGKRDPGMKEIREAILGKPKILEAHKEEKWAMEIKKIQVKKNDIIILEMKEDITQQNAGYLVDLLSKTFPVNKSIVICKGQKLYPLPEKILNDMGWYKRKKAEDDTMLPKADPKDDEKI